jgi:hypothetical protein
MQRWGAFGPFVACLAVGVTACAAASQPVRDPAGPPAPPAGFVEDGKPLSHFHSKRFALSLALPDGHAWRIDDHSRPELVATHAPTHSKIVVLVVRTEELVGRKQCEAFARDRKLVPKSELTTIEDADTVTQETFDTRVWVALEASHGPAAPIVGHVMAFGGFLRKCFVFDYSTSVDGPAEEAVLSARLAYARARILSGLSLDPFLLPPRESPGGEGEGR